MDKARHIYSPKLLKEKLPLGPKGADQIAGFRRTIRSILNGEDHRLLLIVGPCSIHDNTAAEEYATKLAALAKELSEQFFIVMRAYVEKPRTKLGWKGFMHDPNLDHSCDIAKGIDLSRRLFLTLTALGLPIGLEFLDPFSVPFFEDLISWGCIGARTSESQTHRQMASALAMPVAFKNNTDGNIDVAIHGALVAQHPQTFLGIGEEGMVNIITSKGNPDTHIILRGSEHHPNYGPKPISEAIEKLQIANLSSKILIDCSHGNSNRLSQQQPIVFQSVIHQILEGNFDVRGLQLESFLLGGKQPHGPRQTLRYGLSITDACLDWNTTEALLKWGRDKLCLENYAKAFYNRSITNPSCALDPIL